MPAAHDEALRRVPQDEEKQDGSSVVGFVAPKKRELPRGAGEEDRKRFAKASSYMTRLDDLVACYKCRKRFELTGQSTVLINDNLGDPDQDPENFGNR